ncbi:hypothetical protein SLA2020_384520 [Shorea laevis]
MNKRIGNARIGGNDECSVPRCGVEQRERRAIMADSRRKMNNNFLFMFSLSLFPLFPIQLLPYTEGAPE